MLTTNLVAPELRELHALGLRAEDSFWTSSASQRAARCNGAGAADGIKVPTTMWGLSVREIFDIHDWDYHEGGDNTARTIADIRMLVNGHKLIEHRTTQLPGIRNILCWLRGVRLNTYFRAVRDFGAPAFNFHR